MPETNSHTNNKFEKESDELKIPAFLRKKKRGVSRRKGSKMKSSASSLGPSRNIATRRAKKKKIQTPKKSKKAVVAKGRATKKKPRSKKGVLTKVKAKPKSAAKEKSQKKVVVGHVTHYFDKIKVAIILVAKPINQGQVLNFVGLNDFKQEISSMQFHHQEVKSAKKGQEIGVKVKNPVRPGDNVYLYD